MPKRPGSIADGLPAAARPPAALLRGAARRRTVLAALLAGTLGGCATYRPLPLPTAPDLHASVPLVNARALRRVLPPLAKHTFDASNGLDMDEVAMLAVVGNPGLAAQRASEGVARAQVLSAGLLPDPQFSFSLDHPTDAVPGLTNALALGLNYDVSSFVTRGARVQAARAGAGKVHLDLLWQEWQVIQQARTLFVHLVYLRHKLLLVKRMRKLYAARYARALPALRRGDLTLETAGTDLTALLDAGSQASRLRRRVDQTRHDLNALLGLAPQVRLQLSPLPAPRLLARPALQDALRTLQARRPDLLALQAGYRSQEAEVRRAVLAQFPTVSVGFTHANDTSDVHTVGFGITLNLPLLNANRGDIAVQRATRALLRREYQARLDRARGQIDALWQRQRLIEPELATLHRYLPQLAQMVVRARQAYKSGNIDALTYLNMENTMLQKRLERVDLEDALWQSAIALDTLLAWPGAARAPGTTQAAR